MEHQDLGRELKAEQDMEGIVGTVEAAWEKTAVGTQTETEMGKRMAATEKTVEETWKTNRVGVFVSELP
jgi:hypothetical protein